MYWRVYVGLIGLGISLLGLGFGVRRLLASGLQVFRAGGAGEYGVYPSKYRMTFDASRHSGVTCCI